MDLSELLYSDMKHFIDSVIGGRLNALAVAVIIKQAMKYAMLNEVIRNLSGSEKKELVISVCTKLIEDVVNKDTNLSDDDKLNIRFALTFAPTLIDSIVDFAKSYTKDSAEKGRKFFCC